MTLLLVGLGVLIAAALAQSRTRSVDIALSNDSILKPLGFVQLGQTSRTPVTVGAFPGLHALQLGWEKLAISGDYLFCSYWDAEQGAHFVSSYGIPEMQKRWTKPVEQPGYLLSRQGALFLSDEDSILRLDPATGNVKYEISIEGEGNQDLRIVGPDIVLLQGHTVLKVCDLRTGRVRWRRNFQPGYNTIEMIWDGLIMVYHDGKREVFLRSNGESVAYVDGSSEGSPPLYISSLTPFLCSDGGSGTVRCVDLRPYHEETFPKEPAETAMVLNIVTNASGGRQILQGWSCVTSDRIWSMAITRAWRLDWLDDRKFYFDDEGRDTIIDAVTGHILVELEGPQIQEILSGSNGRLISLGYGGDLLIHHLETGQLLHRMESHDGARFLVATDGKRVALRYSSSLKLYEVQPPERKGDRESRSGVDATGG